MLLSRNKKKLCIPLKTSVLLYIYKWGLRRSKLYKYVFVMIGNRHSLIRAFAVFYKHTDSASRQQILSARMRRQICAFAVCISPNIKFVRRDSFANVVSFKIIFFQILNIKAQFSDLLINSKLLQSCKRH